VAVQAAIFGLDSDSEGNNRLNAINCRHPELRRRNLQQNIHLAHRSNHLDCDHIWYLCQLGCDCIVLTANNICCPCRFGLVIIVSVTIFNPFYVIVASMSDTYLRVDTRRHC
jgi:hypothetical protein